jgi:glycosyltransferase involved in cell wall biosynthesis
MKIEGLTMAQPIDVAVMTYNSEKYLEQALDSLFKAVKVRRLIVMDHYSRDKTLEIAKKFNAEVYMENISLGARRQLAIKKVETPIFMFFDSDIVFLEPFNWFENVMTKLESDRTLAAIVMTVSMSGRTPKLAHLQYAEYWNEKQPWTMRWGFTTGSTFIKKEALSGLSIPSGLDAREDRYMELHIVNEKKMKFDNYTCNGVHYFDYPNKGPWGGANERILTGLRNLPYNFVRRIITAPLKAIPPMIHYRNPQILFWNTRYWMGYLKGYLQPSKYRKSKR